MADKKHCKVLDQLKHRELTLRKREEILNERELKLVELEKRISLRAKMMEEMYQKAETYLKYCHQYYTKHEQQQLLNTKSKQKQSYEDLDSTYVSCGDSVVQEGTTSKKLDVASISKPHHFTRTLSERRIRFKGHSPLTDLDYNRKKIGPTGKTFHKSSHKVQSKTSGSSTSEGWLTCSEEAVEYVLDDNRKGGNEAVENKVCSARRSICWTQEDTRRAFQLLRVMNGLQKENVQPILKATTLKHTRL
ncbi:unnamed protein product [Callosobruchus maculatus]|nr:unnamed protein product [Callosobruchus maculatus]